MRTLTGLIPFVALALLCRTFAGRWRVSRASILSAAVVWGVAVTAITEGLSLFRLLSFGPVLAVWLALIAALVLKCARDRSAACPP